MLFVEPQAVKDALEFFSSFSELFTKATKALEDAVLTDNDVREALATIYLLSQTDDEIAGWAIRWLEKEEKEKEEAAKKATAEQSTEAVKAESTKENSAPPATGLANIVTTRTAEGQKDIEQETTRELSIDQERDRLKKDEKEDMDRVLVELIRYGDYIGVWVKGKKMGHLDVKMKDLVGNIAIRPLALGSLLCEVTGATLVSTGYYTFGRVRERPTLTKSFQMWNKYNSNLDIDIESSTSGVSSKHSVKLEDGFATMPMWQFAAILAYFSQAKIVPTRSKHGVSYFLVKREILSKAKVAA